MLNVNLFRNQLQATIALLFLLMFTTCKADHYYGGYITYTHIGGYTYKASVVTYADNDKINSDRDSVEVVWGDGTVEWIQRVNNLGNGETVFPGIKKNLYEGIHTYSAPGNYQLVFIDDFRPFDIFNIAAGRSGSTLLYFDAVIPVADTLTFCINNAPSFKTEPYMFAKPGNDFYLSLTHFDIDGDSLSFKLTEPKARNAQPVPDYYRPVGASIDEKTGLFKWENPPFGNYVFAYEIEEFRNNQLIGVSVADFPVFISNDNFEVGTFTNIEGWESNQYHFSAPEVVTFEVQYENTLADSVQINVLSPVFDNASFAVLHKQSNGSKLVNDTLVLTYLGNDFNQGNQLITYEIVSFFGSDLLYDYRSYAVSTADERTWPCSVPANIRDVVELPPVVDLYDISPNLFTNDVWINVGASFANTSIEVYDTRGRLVAREENLSEDTFKMELGHLSGGMYLFRFTLNGETLTVVKTVKK